MYLYVLKHIVMQNNPNRFFSLKSITGSDASTETGMPYVCIRSLRTETEIHQQIRKIPILLFSGEAGEGKRKSAI